MKFSSKQEVREYVWKTLSKAGVALFPNFGKIPNFKGALQSAKVLTNLEEWKQAKTIFCSPDKAQEWVRYFAIKEGKNVIMATPRLSKGFVLLEAWKVKPEEVRFLRKAITKGKTLGWQAFKPELLILGSVAVDLKGNRIGKGGGYGDREIKFFRERFGKIIIATNVHELQIFDDLSYLMQEHDEKVDIVVTNERVIKIKK